LNKACNKFNVARAVNAAYRRVNFVDGVDLSAPRWVSYLPSQTPIGKI